MPTPRHRRSSWTLFWISSCCIGKLWAPHAALSSGAAPENLFAPTNTHLSQPGTSALTQAIVQLQGLSLTPPITQGTTIVPLQDDPWRLLTIKGTVNQQPETFLIDTGASTTLLSKSFVKRLGLEGTKISGDRLSSAVAGTACPTMDANLHQLPSLKIGSVQVNKLAGLEFLDTTIPYQLSGILGMNLLSNFDLKIYPKTRQVSLSPRTSLPQTEAGIRQERWQSSIIPLERRLGVMLAQIKINQKGPFTVLIDTGASSTFISPKAAQAAKVTTQSSQPVQVEGFCGLEPAYRVMTPTMQLGIYQVQQVDTIVLDSSVLTSLQVDGILGQNILNRFNQYWRFPNPNLPDQQAQGSLHLSPVNPPPQK